MTVLVTLRGGLGNQLFQFAAAFSYSRRNSQRLLLDIGQYSQAKRGETPREPDLLNFIDGYELAAQMELERIKNPYGLISKMSRAVEKKIYRRFNIDWNPEAVKPRKDKHFDGYFQDERFFSEHRNELQRLILLKQSLSKPLQRIVSGVREINDTVAVHVRRGDYVKIEKIRKMHFVCGESYYKKAIDEAFKKIVNPKFIIFSDDINWVRDNFYFLKGSHFIYSDELARNQMESPSYASIEFELMRNCKNFIISNSTYSWWAANLGTFRTDGMVWAPNRWINNQKTHRDIVPVRWFKISVP